MKILSFKKFEKNTLRGFLEIEMPSGMCVRDLTLHAKDNSRWIGYPSKQYTKEDGSTDWQNQIYFEDKEIHNRFQAKVIAALDAHLGNEPDDDIPF